jgi:hypothetical protein
MAEKTTSQTQQNFEDWFKSIQTEWEKIEAKGQEQARQAIDETARLMKESLVYASKLAADFRRLYAVKA